jgi:GDP-D-mannose dehydratase
MMKKALITGVTAQDGSYSKVFAHYMGIDYREAYGIHAATESSSTTSHRDVEASHRVSPRVADLK